MPDTKLRLRREPGWTAIYYFDCPACCTERRVFDTSPALDGLRDYPCLEDSCKERGTQLRFINGNAVDVTGWKMDLADPNRHTYEVVDTQSLIDARTISEN